MVIFDLKEETDNYISFLYFPEGDESARSGVIVVDKAKEEITVTAYGQKSDL